MWRARGLATNLQTFTVVRAASCWGVAKAGKGEEGLWEQELQAKLFAFASASVRVPFWVEYCSCASSKKDCN
jgi:hypothetical protein